MAEPAGSEAPANGMLRCTRCSRFYAPDDMEGWGTPDFLRFAIECRACFRQRTGG